MNRILAFFALLAAGIFQSAATLSYAAEPQKQWAVVDISSCFLRAQPDYESGNESQCLMGTVVEITGSDRYWRRVNAPDYRNVWTNELALAPMNEEQISAYKAAPKWVCISEHSYIYTSPDRNSERIGDFSMGDIVRKGRTAVPPGQAWQPVLTASGKDGWVPAEDVRDLDEWACSVKATRESLVATAKRFLGTPYMWGGNTAKYFDCSGLVKLVYMMNGIVLPRNAREQIRCGEAVPYDFSKMQPGDLIFYGRMGSDGKPASVAHVAMYIGDGRIIHSSQYVRINSLVKGEKDYYERETVGVRRILGNVDSGKGARSAAAAPWYFQ